MTARRRRELEINGTHNLVDRQPKNRGSHNLVKKSAPDAVFACLVFCIHEGWIIAFFRIGSVLPNVATQRISSTISAHILRTAPYSIRHQSAEGTAAAHTQESFTRGGHCGAPGASRRVASGCAGQRVGGLVGCAGLTGMHCRAGCRFCFFGFPLT